MIVKLLHLSLALSGVDPRDTPGDLFALQKLTKTQGYGAMML